MNEDMRVNDGAAANMDDRNDLGLSIDDSPNPDTIEAAAEGGHELIELEMSTAQATEEAVMPALSM